MLLSLLLLFAAAAGVVVVGVVHVVVHVVCAVSYIHLTLPSNRDV